MLVTNYTITNNDELERAVLNTMHKFKEDRGAALERLIYLGCDVMHYAGEEPEIYVKKHQSADSFKILKL